MDATEQIFTDSQFKANEERKRKLIKLIADGDAILLVGSGMSKLSGFPLWNELLEIFENKILEHNPNFNKGRNGKSNIDYATVLKDELGSERYNALIHKIFSDNSKTPTQCHSSIVALPFRGILTTNFDWMLEYALNKKLSTEAKFNNPLNLIIGSSPREAYKFLRGLNENKNGVDVIAHLHGDYKNANSIVLCAKDYVSKYGVRITNLDPLEFEEKGWTLERKILWSLISTRRLVYIGFSMNDDYFKIMHQITCEDLGSYEEDTHYLIERITSKEEAITKLATAVYWKENYAVESIFFEENAAGSGLEQLIYEVEKGVSKILTPIPLKVELGTDKKPDQNIEGINLKLMKKAIQNSDEN